MVIHKGRTVLFNDTLNTFYLQLHGIRHIVEGKTNQSYRNKQESYLS